MNKFFLLGIITCFVFNAFSQERVVKVDFESSSFKNAPSIPYDQSFMIEGEVYRDVEYVTVDIFDENGNKPIHSYSWNRDERNQSETFSILIPNVLTSNNKYDFKISTYKALSDAQKMRLKQSLENRITYYLQNNYSFDGKNVVTNSPQKTYKGLKELIDNAFTYYLSKNNIPYSAPGKLILEELKKNNNFKFNSLLSGSKNIERDSIANQLIAEKIDHMTEMIISEILPYLNTSLVQLHSNIIIPSVATDKSPFTLPVNVGMYAWNMVFTNHEASFKDTNFTPGAGITLPFYRKTSLKSRNRIFDSVGLSVGVLFSPIKDENGKKYVTPGINLPLYTALGLRMFKVTRLNAGVLVVGEKGLDNVNQLKVVPTIGLSFELDLWLGIKK